MKSQWIKRGIVSGAVVVAGLIVLDWSWAQEPANVRTEAELKVKAEFEQLEHAKRAVAEAKRAADHARQAYGMGRGYGGYAGPDSMTALRQAAEALRDAEGEDAKEDAERKLNELLSQYFDQDMERRKAELEDIQERVRKLTEQLARRREKKQEIIDLQVKVLVNEADGLGFFSNAGPAASVFGPMGEQFKIMGPNWEVPVPVGPPVPTTTPASD